MTRGQHLAIDQVKAISEQNPASIEILEVKTQQTTPNDFCWLRLSLKLGQLTRVSGGLAVRQREQVWIGIHPDFPFRVPVVRVPHKRFANHPHVQWLYTLCLYQAPSTEWDSSDGIFGLLYRLLVWFKAAARNELDPIGAPLHPPVAYTSHDTPQILPTVNAPQVAEGPWCGWVELETRTNHVRLGEWHSIDQSSAVSAPVAAAILLSAEFPFEYPSEVPDLISLVEKQGIPRKFSALLFEGAALRSKKDDPIFVVIGTPMRGIGGADRRIQHLSVWMIDSVGADSLRLACEKYSGVEELREIGKKCEDLFLDWCNIKVKTKWCSVREARPEVLVARDQETNMKVFKGNTVAIWGCGALGSHFAEMLVRAGVSRLILRDNRRVAPGLLCRQLFEENDIGRGKAVALRDRLKRIDPAIDIIAFGSDLLSDPLESESRLDEVDLIIDTSANQTVLSKLELRLKNKVVERPAIVSVSISHDAKAGLFCLCQPGYSGGPLDALRRMKIDVTRNPSLNSFADTFWPRESRVDQLFQPEPGCSDPTFSGSSADLMSLSGYLLNQLSISLQGTKSSECSVGLFNLSDLSNSHPRQHYKRFHSEYCINDPQFGYEIRIDHAALAEIKAWTSRNARQNSAKVETGGLTFGEWDESIQICWVSEVLGPPPDSLHSSKGFVSGIEGTDVVNEEKKTRSRGSIRYIGNWHTHPVSSAFPSSVDLTGMGRILQGYDDTPAKALLLIVGNAMTTPHLGAHVFSRREFSSLGSKGFYLRQFSLSPLTFSRPKHDIGLTLSGGGLRAVAFHLGCLRALHDRGILPRIMAISAVSGGSIIAAMYAYESESFDEFDRRVVSLLKEGLDCTPEVGHIRLG